jgi:hypothetical protein
MGNGMIKRLRSLKTLDREPGSGDTKGVRQSLQPEVPDRYSIKSKEKVTKLNVVVIVT